MPEAEDVERDLLLERVADARDLIGGLPELVLRAGEMVLWPPGPIGRSAGRSAAGSAPAPRAGDPGGLDVWRRAGRGLMTVATDTEARLTGREPGVPQSREVLEACLRLGHWLGWCAARLAADPDDREARRAAGRMASEVQRAHRLLSDAAGGGGPDRADPGSRPPTGPARK